MNKDDVPPLDPEAPAVWLLRIAVATLLVLALVNKLGG